MSSTHVQALTNGISSVLAYLSELFSKYQSSHKSYLLKYGTLSFVGLWTLKRCIVWCRDWYSLSSIPTVGPSGPLSYFSAIRFLRDARPFMQEGYDKYNGGAFKVPVMNRWWIAVSGPDMIRDIRQSTTDELSFHFAIAERLQMKYTMGPAIVTSHYQNDVVRTLLTRNITHKFSEVFSEMESSFHDLIPASDEWIKISPLKTMKQMACRMSNRHFIGLPACQDPDYIDLFVKFSIQVAYAAQSLTLYPDWLKPIVSKFFINLNPVVTRAMKHLGPMIEERIRLHKEADLSGMEDKRKNLPNDLITWLLEESPEELKTTEDVIRRIMMVNFAAIHTTSGTLTHAIHSLAAYPSAYQELYKEVSGIIEREGWSKGSLNKMIKLDSFLQEVMRFIGSGICGSIRKVVKDFTFSNGLVVPAGNILCVPEYAIQHDEAYYEEPDSFEPFRFVPTEKTEVVSLEGEDEVIDRDKVLRKGIVTPSSIWLGFGHGRDACPGRFFAVTEMKAILAYLLIHYEIKFEGQRDGEEAKLPSIVSFGMLINPSPSSEILVRKRK